MELKLFQMRTVSIYTNKKYTASFCDRSPVFKVPLEEV